MSAAGIGSTHFSIELLRRGTTPFTFAAGWSERSEAGNLKRWRGRCRRQGASFVDLSFVTLERLQ
jgi:hypothetical protein